MQHEFARHGFYAPLVLLQQPGLPHPKTLELAAPILCQTVRYDRDVSAAIAWSGPLTVEISDVLSAGRFVTRNVLAIVVEEGRTIDWWNQYLVLPVKAPLQVSADEVLAASFAYQPGDSIDELAASLQITRAASGGRGSGGATRAGPNRQGPER